MALIMQYYIFVTLNNLEGNEYEQISNYFTEYSMCRLRVYGAEGYSRH